MVDKKKFFGSYKSIFGLLRSTQSTGLERLVDFFNEDEQQYDLRHVAYMLATVKHECADRWEPITEFGKPPYFAKYEFNTNLGRDLGNIHPGDGLLYKGRGYVMITGRANYSRFSKKIQLSGPLDLLSHPDRATDPAVSYRIMTIGCIEGSFTGICLSKYINDKETDYVNARRVINGLDKAKLIAGYAQSFESILKNSIE